MSCKHLFGHASFHSFNFAILLFEAMKFSALAVLICALLKGTLAACFARLVYRLQLQNIACISPSQCISNFKISTFHVYGTVFYSSQCVCLRAQGFGEVEDRNGLHVLELCAGEARLSAVAAEYSMRSLPVDDPC